MSRHQTDADLYNAAQEHLGRVPPEEASRAQKWLERGTLLGDALKRLLPRSRGSQAPHRESARGPSGTPAE